MPGKPIAIVDVGSNSGRVVVVRIGGSGHVEILANGRAPLRLARDLRDEGDLTAKTIERTAAALRDFEAIAESAGVAMTIAVATSAVRESSNAADLLSRIERESGTRVRVIGGDEEAFYTLLGAIHGLPVRGGVVADLGGGSLELSRFEHRRSVRSWTLPLGSLRLSDRFLLEDPPAEEEIDRLTRHARNVLEEAGVGQLEPGDRLIGTGGTIRNLGKLDLAGRRYPIPRIHGYELPVSRARELAGRLSSRRLARRRLLAGLSRERADSIVGGSFALLCLMEHLGASEVTISGYGLREGLAFESLDHTDPPLKDVREGSVMALATRFSTWDRGRAERRAAVAGDLLACLEPDASAGAQERLVQAATLLDIGRSVDYYRRYQHTAGTITEADLDGFSHRKLALLSAVVRQAGDEGMNISRYRPLIGPDDRLPVARWATVLALSDAIEQRLPSGHEGGIACGSDGGRVVVEAPVYDPWRQEALARRVRTAFKERLDFRPIAESDDA